MAQLLKQEGTGRVYVSTPELASRNDMRPYYGVIRATKPNTTAGHIAGRPQVERPRAAAAPVNEVLVDADGNEFDAELEVAREQYESLSGRRPHPNMKLDTLQLRIQEMTGTAPADEAPEADDISEE